MKVYEVPLYAVVRADSPRAAWEAAFDAMNAYAEDFDAVREGGLGGVETVLMDDTPANVKPSDYYGG